MSALAIGILIFSVILAIGLVVITIFVVNTRNIVSEIQDVNDTSMDLSKMVERLEGDFTTFNNQRDVTVNGNTIISLSTRFDNITITLGSNARVGDLIFIINRASGSGTTNITFQETTVFSFNSSSQVGNGEFVIFRVGSNKDIFRVFPSDV